MTLRSLDEWFAQGSKLSDLQPGDLILVQVDMSTPHYRVIEYWPFRVVEAPSASHVMGESLPKTIHGKRTVLHFGVVLLDRDRCLGPWRAAAHRDGDPACELDDCLDFSHYVRSA